MTVRLSPAVQRAHLATQQRLLELEREGSARLLSGVAAATDGLHRATYSALIRASQDVARVVADAVRVLRAGGRQAGRSTLAHEMRVAAEAADRPGFQRVVFPVVDAPTLADEIAADRSANDYAAAWVSKAADDGAAQATASTRHRAAAIGASEAGHAFSVERDATMKRMSRQPEFTGAGIILKVWDARLDACPKCHDLDGKIRPLGFSFPGDKIAGAVHRRCRCIAGILILSAGTVSEAA